ncbi:unnamed protein product, partial [Rotaria sp. Silwood2]
AAASPSPVPIATPSGRTSSYTLSRGGKHGSASVAMTKTRSSIGGTLNCIH